MYFGLYIAINRCF